MRALIALLLIVGAPAIAAEGDRSDLSGETVLDVSLPSDIADRTHRFEAHLQKLGLSDHILSCQGMIDLPGRCRGRDHSYGAVCKLDSGGKQADVMLCDDTLFGHFAMRADKFDSAREALAMFTDENCTGE